MHIKSNKVMIGTITFDDKEYILERFISRVKELTYPNMEFVIIDTSENDDYFKRICELVGDFGIVIKDPYYEDTRENCCKARNHLRQIFLDSDCEYLFHLEQDVIPRKDIIEELIQWKKLAVGGWYYINQGYHTKRACVFKGFMPIEGPYDQKGKMMALQPYKYDLMGKERLFKCYLGSLGVTLIHRDLFEKIGIKFWWDRNLTWHDDVSFFHDLDVRGIDYFIDTDLLVSHFQSNWAIEKFWNKINIRKAEQPLIQTEVN